MWFTPKLDRTAYDGGGLLGHGRRRGPSRRCRSAASRRSPAGSPSVAEGPGTAARCCRRTRDHPVRPSPTVRTVEAWTICPCVAEVDNDVHARELVNRRRSGSPPAEADHRLQPQDPTRSPSRHRPRGRRGSGCRSATAAAAYVRPSRSRTAAPLALCGPGSPGSVTFWSSGDRSGMAQRLCGP
jgi:hypothetical protein